MMEILHFIVVVILFTVTVNVNGQYYIERNDCWIIFNILLICVKSNENTFEKFSLDRIIS